jgi:hypothetical protein
MPAFYLARQAAPGPVDADFVKLQLQADPLTLRCAAPAGVWHYFRFADGTVKVLPPRPEPLIFEPGDTYLALSPSARQVTDSPTVARFLHLHDVFNAEKLASALLAQLIENFGGTFPETVTVVVVEAR